MTKQPKLRLSLLSFQLCRPMKSSSLPKVPLPVGAYKFSSTVNSRSFDISYHFPSPPPSTPNQSFRKCHMSSKISSLGSGSCSMHVTSKCKHETSSPVYHKMKKVDKPNAKIHNSTVSRFEREGKRDKITTKKSKASVCTSTSSGESDKTKSLLSSSPRSDLPYDSDCCPLKTEREGPLNETKKMKQRSTKSQRFKHCTSNDGKDGNRALLESESRVKKSVCMVDGKVKESFIIEKRSEDPYEDFKTSMLEMILEKQMFDANELDQLVMCFLSLNSPQYHSIILKAFVEIWEELFGESTN